MSEVTRIVSAIEEGDQQAAEQLLPLVYDELRKLAARKLAQKKPGQTLQATASASSSCSPPTSRAPASSNVAPLGRATVHYQPIAERPKNVALRLG
jgi:hypothetical protein